jgi:hypothetical protein
MWSKIGNRPDRLAYSGIGVEFRDKISRPPRIGTGIDLEAWTLTDKLDN